MIPSKGYLGVGIVKEIAKPINDFVIENNGKSEKIINITLNVDGIKNNADNLDICEYLVKVDWIKTVPESKAYWEKGMRANQNSAFKLKNEFTLDKLVKFFGLDE